MHPSIDVSDYEHLWRLKAFEIQELKKAWDSRHKVSVERSKKTAPLTLSDLHRAVIHVPLGGIGVRVSSELESVVEEAATDGEVDATTTEVGDDGRMSELAIEEDVADTAPADLGDGCESTQSVATAEAIGKVAVSKELESSMVVEEMSSCTAGAAANVAPETADADSVNPLDQVRSDLYMVEINCLPFLQTNLSPNPQLAQPTPATLLASGLDGLHPHG